MQTQHITLTRESAGALFRDYQKHLHYAEPIDREIARAYQLLSRGRLIIKAIESVMAAGVNSDGFPKLALCTATATTCFLHLRDDGSAIMADQASWSYRSIARHGFAFAKGSFAVTGKSRFGQGWDAKAVVPPCPLHMRPKRGLANYHILFEAEWTNRVPHDPYLVRRLGKADLWLVVAMWNLTEVERAALATRLPA